MTAVAQNSRREQILIKLEAALEALDSIKTVERTLPNGLSDLDNYAEPQLPLAAMVGNLPKPVYKISTRDGHTVDKVTSVLGVNLYVYAHDNVTPDTTISTLADDVWRQMLADETHGFKWVSGTEVHPDINTAVWAPYCAFNMLINVTYLHSKGGI
jgi:hypothetical protein